MRTLIHSATPAVRSKREQWSIYRLKTTDRDLDERLFLPPTTAKLQESASIERVILTCDEMATMLWGIEDTIPSWSGGGTSGFEGRRQSG